MTRLADVEIERKHRLRARFFRPSHHPSERRLAELGAEQPRLGADGGIADFGQGKYLANQILAAFRDRQRTAAEAVEKVDLLNGIDAQLAGQPELVDAAADVAIAVFEQ